MEDNFENIPEGFYKDPKTGSIVSKQCSCGKKNQQIDECAECTPKAPKGIFGMNGWLCPACGRGNSPFSSSCPCVPFPQYPVTCQGSGLNNPIG